MLLPLAPRARTRPAAPPLPILPITVIGFDLSLTGTGVAIYKHGKIETQLWSPKTKGVVRLMDLRERMRRLLLEEYPGAVGIEGYSFGSANSRPHSIGEWGGIAKLEVANRPRTQPFIASPSTVKKFMTGSGNAKKALMPLHLFKRYGLTIEQEDEADATCVSILTGAHLYPSAFALTQFQIDALTGIEKML